MNTQDAVKDLRALSRLINTSIDQIENEMLSRGQTYPLLSEPYSPETEEPRMAPDILAAGSIITAAAAQLIASVSIPVVSALVTSLQYEVSSSLRAAIQAHVPEILREFGNKGLHVRDIAAHTKVDPSRLGFNWETLPPQSTVVDVGSGIGSMSLELAEAFPHLNFVLQDTPATLANAMNFWSMELPEAINTDRVVLQAHDFFEAQPVKQPSVFLMRMILHDWSDDKAVNILRHLCVAAGPETQLVIVDKILSYACTEDSFVGDIPGAVVERLPPSPLLPNFGYAAVSWYLADLMLNCHNGTERTLVQFRQILEDSGWKITNVHRSEDNFSKITAAPAHLVPRNLTSELLAKL
ncbi:hypothetical protein EW026_g3996 [Hermanssonia centrifuga]|uniref:O-methyltransferase C-terminal domain-containing protein n=1 Tax=Hermanssonia centrifuga TaxID=98765 RepID=A0A4S4KIX6_9APHY|nr:hypothetical protein EW026_g3996 [Hermanssonia centrifuga]